MLHDLRLASMEQLRHFLRSMDYGTMGVSTLPAETRELSKSVSRRSAHGKRRFGYFSKLNISGSNV